MYIPMAISEKIQAYLQRIGYAGPINTSVETLSRLQECHLHTVPYENLDILLRKPLSLEIDDLFEKMVVHKRGGYCFELNALFGWLLKELGFSVVNLFARFWRDEPNPPPKRRHHVLRVEAEGKHYLCDVGVGGIVPRRPIVIEEGLEQQQGDEHYRMERDEAFGWYLCEWKGHSDSTDGAWRPIYSFTDEPQLAKDFIMASYWCEHAPESIFTQSAMIAIRTNEGRNTVAGREFRIFKGTDVHTFVPENEEEYRTALQTYFGIILDSIEKHK